MCQRGVSSNAGKAACFVVSAVPHIKQALRETGAVKLWQNPELGFTHEFAITAGNVMSYGQSVQWTLVVIYTSWPEVREHIQFENSIWQPPSGRGLCQFVPMMPYWALIGTAAHCSGVTRRYTVDEPNKADTRVRVWFSNPDEYGNDHPVALIFPVLKFPMLDREGLMVLCEPIKYEDHGEDPEVTWQLFDPLREWIKVVCTRSLATLATLHKDHIDAWASNGADWDSWRADDVSI